MASILKEFREFAVKGNVLDLAVGVVIGTAFGKIVASFVADVIMPLVGILVGGINFTYLKFTLKAASSDSPAVTLNYGALVQSIVDFTIIAFAIFMVIKSINRFKKKEEEKPAEPSAQEVLLGEIRDILKKQNP